MMKARGEERVGVNLASMLPWSALPLIGLWIARWISRKAGFAFWQVLPLRSISVPALKKVGVPVAYLEPAWNATTLLGHLRGDFGSEGMPTKWQDVLFFPNPTECGRLFEEVENGFGARIVLHHLGDSVGLVEFHPGLGVSAKRLAEYVNAVTFPSKSIVLDICHIRRTEADELRSDKEYWSDFMVLLPYTALIYIQAWDGMEWQRFVDGKGTQLDRMLKYAVEHGFEGDFVVEYRPGAVRGIAEILFPWILARSLRRVRGRVEEIVGRKET